MNESTRKNSAVKILHERYVGEDEARKASLQVERINADVAQMIYDIRKEAGLSQKALADLVKILLNLLSVAWRILIMRDIPCRCYLVLPKHSAETLTLQCLPTKIWIKPPLTPSGTRYDLLFARL